MLPRCPFWRWEPWVFRSAPSPGMEVLCFPARLRCPGWMGSLSRLCLPLRLSTGRPRFLQRLPSRRPMLRRSRPLLTFNPAFTLLIAWLTLDEVPGLRQTLGVVVVLLGAYLL